MDKGKDLMELRIVTSKQMKQIERNAVQYQMSYLRLMENAGCAAASFIQKMLHDVDDLVCVVFCGRGNNGGDGLVVARKLRENGGKVVVVLMDQEPQTPDALQMYHIVCSMNLPVLYFEEDKDKICSLMTQVDIVVDAMYGSGFHGEFDEKHREAAQLINHAIAAVFALDVPSGINCDTGEIAVDAIMADFTIAFDSHKPVHVMDKRIVNLGKVQLESIGVDPLAYKDIVQEYFVPDEKEVFSKIPEKPRNAHKTSTGKLLNIAGSMGCTGAAVLSSMAALRSGAGYVVTAIPREIYSIVAPSLIQTPFTFMETAADVPEALRGCSAVAVGCGMGRGEAQRGIVQTILQTAKCPVVIDADGINNLSSDISIVGDASCPVILTPHLGEMARLCLTDTESVEKCPLVCAQRLAHDLRVVVVLKGPNTIIASPDGRTFFNATGNPGLAKAGSGDVLTGMIASLLSQGMEPLDAAVSGVYLHGLAADRCAQRLSMYYMQPDDILVDLGTIFKEHIG